MVNGTDLRVKVEFDPEIIKALKEMDERFTKLEQKVAELMFAYKRNMPLR